ncbi:MAG TPA: ABC transporter ATP-binding protein [Rectinemataceae bacterium]|nr:ABC transporter ATP-binding protein [Rectinemataceae bacterium]
MSETTKSADPVLKVRDLRLHYFTSKGAVKALDGISFDLLPGEALGLVGESGCGKTTTGVALLNMPSPPGRIVGGSIVIDGIEIVGMQETELRRTVRWSKISMVFQGAMNCLTPVYTIRKLMLETWKEHSPDASFNAAAIEERMLKYTRRVGLPDHVLGRYPHELSGGMKQRVVIAMALFLEPKLIIMDEPTTALDVIVQAQILNLIKELKRDLGLSYIFITHDLATEAEVADRIMVMYAGKMAELGMSEHIFGSPESGHRGPLHPYTQKLLASTPLLRKKVSELAFIPGAPPDLIAPPLGCRFAPRCNFAKDKCRTLEPPVIEIEPRHQVACWKAMEDPEYVRS